MDYDDAQNPIKDRINRRQTDDYSHGLYTHNDGSYSFIRIEVGKVWAQGITFSTVGRDLHAEYIALYQNPSERSLMVGAVSDQLAFEAYVLSQALYLSSPIEIGSYTDLVGGAYHYGWHFNWRGDEATICTYRADTAGYNLKGYWYYRYKLQITEDGNGIITAVVTEEEAAYGQPRGTEFVAWFPSYTLGWMQATGPNTCGFTYYDEGYGETSYKIPMYSYYKADGQLEVIYFYKTVGDGTTWEEARDAVLDATCTYDMAINHPGTTSREEQGLCSIDEFGFEASGVKYPVIDNNSGGHYRKKYCTITLQGGSEDEFCISSWSDAWISNMTRIEYVFDYESPNCIYCGCLADLECCYVDFTGVTYTYGGPGVPQRSGKCALIIPWGNCESVMLCMYQREREEWKDYSSRGLTYMNIQQVGRFSTAGPVGDMGKVGIYYPIGGCAYTDGVSTQYSIGGSECNPQHDTQTATTVARDEYLISRYILTPFEATKTDELIRDVVDGLGSYSPLFNPPLCEAYPSMDFTVNKGSVFGHSVRTESQNDPYYGSNCNITIDDVSPDGFWVGWS